MATTSALIDTSIIIDHLRKTNKKTSVLYAIANQFALHVSTVTEFELFVGATDPQKHQDVQKILRLCTTLSFTSDVARQAAALHQRLRAQNQIIDLRDLFIAATAISFDIPLLTLNVRHFARVSALRLIPLP